jgi:hypothetical protein
VNPRKGSIETSPGGEDASHCPSRSRWTAEEDNACGCGILIHGWKLVRIAHEMRGRTANHAGASGNGVKLARVARGPFEEEEDGAIRRDVREQGPMLWERIGIARRPKEIRERYWNHLVEGMRAEPWTAEEDAILAARFQELGCSWRAIARRLPGRSESAVRSRFHRRLKREIFGEGEFETVILPLPIPQRAPRLPGSRPSRAGSSPDAEVDLGRGGGP